MIARRAQGPARAASSAPILTALAIVLGVAMVSGTFVLTDTINQAFDAIFSRLVRADTTPSIIGQGDRRLGIERHARPCPSRCSRAIAALPGRRRRPSGGFDSTTRQARSASDGKAIGDGRRPDVRLRRRPGEPRFNPLTLDDGPLGRGPGRGRRSTQGTADEEGLQGRRHDRRRRRTGPVAALHDLGHRQVRHRRLARRRHARRLRPRRRRSAARQGGPASTASRSRPSPASTPAQLAARDPARCSPPTREVQDRRRAGGSRRRRTSNERARVHPLLPARLRRHRAVRRRVRHLQHALDHGRPAHARVRDAAHARRLAPPGAALGRARGARDRRSSPRSSASSSGSALAKGLNALFDAVGLDLPTAGHGVRDADGRRLAAASASSSRCVAGLCPALRATRVPPIAAVREGAVLPQSRLAPVRAVHRRCVTVLGASPCSPTGMFGSRRLDGEPARSRSAAACSLLFIGVALVSPPARAAAGPRRRLARARRRRRRRHGSRARTRCATRPHRADRGRADDRARARHVRRGARAGPARLDRRARSSDQVSARLRDHVARTASSRSRVGAGAGGRARRPASRRSRASAPTRHACYGKTRYVTGIDPATIARRLQLRLEGGLATAVARRRSAADGAIVDDEYATSTTSGRQPAPSSRPERHEAHRRRSAASTSRTALGSLLGDGHRSSQRAFDAAFPRARRTATRS